MPRPTAAALSVSLSDPSPSLSLSPSPRSQKGEVKLWDVRRPTSTRTFATLSDDVMTMAVHPTADLLAW